MIQEDYRSLADRVLEEVVRAYGERLVSLAVFGSVARGAARPDSDLDILIVAAPLPRKVTARLREFQPVERALAPDLAALSEGGRHTRVAPVFRTPDEALRVSPFLLDMTLHCEILEDRGGFLAGLLDALGARLRELGSVRIETSGGWYWVLKPDLEPGEELTIEVAR